MTAYNLNRREALTNRNVVRIDISIPFVVASQLPSNTANMTGDADGDCGVALALLWCGGSDCVRVRADVVML
jgi:hypothetical protein